jgi:hypothetical protein
MKLFFYCFVLFNFISCKGQTGKIYPEGITVDPGIEKACNQKKNSVNSLNIVYYVNDTVDTNPAINLLGKLPVTPLTKFSADDTVINLMNMLSLSGIFLTFSKTGVKVEYYVSSRSCLCYKDSLSQQSFGYGAAATPGKLTLVLSKKDNFKENDVLYGYIETQGGSYYVKNGNNDPDKRRADYRGYFKVTMSGMWFMK